MQTMRDQIVARIERLGEGKAFSAKDFLDIASRTTIDVTLASLTLSGKIRRIRRGLYDMPKVNPALGGKLSRARHSKATKMEDRTGRGMGGKSPRPVHASAVENHLPDRWPEQ